ncbi:chitosanase [Dongia deserti]|uniref:chitosanase n=1 Tax=Dongia deserti TaxID=2268030 RepID=UPI000E64F964|nr:peptidoglycan-binding protein [Dongia deserti]
MDELQKRTAQAIVNIFETGRALGRYGQVTLLAGDSGQLTYGRSQTTLSSGNLYLLIKAYCDMREAAFADRLRPSLPRLEGIDAALNHDESFKSLLRAAGDDPVMQACQDGFFDRVYWAPAATAAQSLGITTALGVTTVYDSVVHGSWARMRDRTIAAIKRPGDSDEKKWITTYIATRRHWLANHSNTLLRKTVYRMDALQKLVDAQAWALPLPLTVRGVAITEEILSGAPPIRVSAEIAEQRLLRLRSPFMQGGDVVALQEALTRADFALEVDGVFGPATEAQLKAFQARRGLTADGIAGPATRTALGL